MHMKAADRVAVGGLVHQKYLAATATHRNSHVHPDTPVCPGCLTHAQPGSEWLPCSMAASATVRNSAIVMLDFFTVNHEDTAEQDGIQAGVKAAPAQESELASQLHLTQVHDLVVRIGGQLDRLTGEQRHFRSR